MITPAVAENIVTLHTSMGDIKVRLYDDTPIHRDNFLKLAREGYYDGVLFHRVIKDFMIQAGDPNSKSADSTTMLGDGDPGYTLEAEIKYPTHYHKYGALAAARTGDQVNPERRSSGSQFYIVVGKKQSQRALDQMSQQANFQRKQAYFNGLCKQHIEEIRQFQKAGDRQALDSLKNSLVEITEKNVPDQPLPQQLIDDYLNVGGTPHLDAQYTVFGEVIEGMDIVEAIQNVETGVADRPKIDVKIISAKVD